MEIWLKKEKKLVLQFELFEDNDELLRIFYCHRSQTGGGEKYAQKKNCKCSKRSKKVCENDSDSQKDASYARRK